MPDWPGSEADSLMIQARDRVELLGVRYVEFESPTWREDNTFRGWAQFGLRVYGLKGLSAVISLVREVLGQSEDISGREKVMKRAVIKASNLNKKKNKRKGATIRDVLDFVKIWQSC